MIGKYLLGFREISMRETDFHKFHKDEKITADIPDS